MPRMIGCVYSIHPTQIELYALRLLLNHVRGARSYEELRTFTINSETTTHNSFQAAAVARDLVNNDNMWIECMKEADETETNIYRLRRLFVTILRECHLGDHAALYDKCKDMLSADYRYKYKHEFETHPLLGQTNVNASNQDSDNNRWTMEQFAINSALCNMEIMLGKTGKSLTEFGLPSPDMEKEQFLQTVYEINTLQMKRTSLPSKQKHFMKRITQSLTKIRGLYLIT